MSDAAAGHPAPEEPLERLRLENEALNEQVKLLVRTEQRLQRFQQALDRQLSRIRSLAECALRCSRSEEPIEILEEAMSVLLGTFDLDRAVAGRFEPDTARLHMVTRRPDGVRQVATLPAEPALREWLRDRPQACICAGVAACTEHVERILAAFPDIDPEERRNPSERSLTVCLPIRHAEGEILGLVLALKHDRASASYYKELPEDPHLPFLQLLAAHVERALQTAILTRDLRERGEELAESNRRLQRSLERLERTQGELLQAQKMEAIGRLAGGIAHDFNNILTVVLGHAELLKDRFSEGSAGSEDLGDIIDAAGRAATITSHLLAFGRKQPRSPEIIDINELTERMGRMLRRVIGEHVSLHRRANLRIGSVRADRGQLEQIILNLVLNARDAMNDGGDLTIETRPARPEDAREVDEKCDPSEYVALVVSDTGHGMDGETRRQIFEPFFTTKEAGRGTGLGLAMVYGLVKQNGGHILVRSEVGRGTSFVVLLPQTAASTVVAHRRTTPSEPAERGLATVLVAEDEESIRDLTCRVLRDRGYRVLSASDGEEALDVARQHGGGIDLLLTDVVMPRLGGVELARRLRGERGDLRVLMMSGYAFDDLAPEIAAGENFLRKPFRPAEVLERVRDALKR